MTDERQPSEEELRQLEEELRRVTVDDLLLQSAVSLINLGGRKAGMAPGTEGERDLPQVQAAIDAVTALLPVLERRAGDGVRPIRDALAQLQLAYARLAGEGTAEPPGEGPGKPGEAASEGGGPAKPGPAQPTAEPGEPGPAQRSGRLWVPGQ